MNNCSKYGQCDAPHKDFCRCVKDKMREARKKSEYWKKLNKKRKVKIN